MPKEWKVKLLTDYKKKLEKELKQLRDLMNYDPGMEFVDLSRQLHDLHIKCKAGRISNQSYLDKFKILTKKRDDAYSRYKKYDIVKTGDKCVKLQIILEQVDHELYWEMRG